MKFSGADICFIDSFHGLGVSPLCENMYIHSSGTGPLRHHGH